MTTHADYVTMFAGDLAEEIAELPTVRMLARFVPGLCQL